MHSLIHRTNEIKLLTGGKKTNALNQWESFLWRIWYQIKIWPFCEPHSLETSQPEMLAFSENLGPAGLEGKICRLQRREEPSSRQSKSTGLSWELLRESKGHLAAVLGVGSDTRSSPKISFSSSYTSSSTSGAAAPAHPLPANAPSLTSSQPRGRAAASQELRGSSAAPSDTYGICVVLSHRLQTGWVTLPLPPQLLQKNSDGI